MPYVFIASIDHFYENILSMIIIYQVFWERYKELTDYERIINVITKGEERIEKKVRMKKALAQKVSNYQKPEIQLKISPSFSKFSKYEGFHFRWFNIKGINATFSTSITI